MHIFLTGERQVGKSTMIRRFLSDTGGTADGFVTYWEASGDGKRNLYLAPFTSGVSASGMITSDALTHDIATANTLTPDMSTSDTLTPDKITSDASASNVSGKNRYLITHDKGRGLVFSKSTIRAFEVYGCEIVNSSGKCDFIVMDELGFLETKAPDFKQAVMRRISGTVPVLGVMKASKTGFLNQIRAHPNVIIREVTKENRNEVLQWLQEQNPYLFYF